MPSAADFSLHHTYRLVTRSDFDGVVCAVLLKELGVLNGVRFVDPGDVRNGTIALTEHDVTTNLPYRPEVALAFDHHLTETEHVSAVGGNRIVDLDADSAARVVYSHFGGARSFPHISEELMTAVDRADASRLTLDDVLYPSGWVLLSFLIDSHTGLGRVHDFRISDDALMTQLIDSCTNLSIEEILRSPDVIERIELYREHSDFAAEQLLRCSGVHGKVVVIDLRGELVVRPANRFLVYALYPECTVSIQVLSGPDGETVFALERSILDRSSTLDIGSLMLARGGGGHEAAGTYQVANDRADATLGELVSTIAGAEAHRTPRTMSDTGLPETLADALASMN